jgi:DNA-binding NarL/FixJ family response regulator
MTLKEILTPRQFEMASLVRYGYENSEIAKEMRLKENSVKQRLYRIYVRLGFSKRVELAVRFALEEAEGCYSRRAA